MKLAAHSFEYENDTDWEETIDIHNPKPLSAYYEGESEKLNKAWLSTIISDGPNEASRQAILAAQMATLDQQLDADIEAIFTGEGNGRRDQQSYP